MTSHTSDVFSTRESERTSLALLARISTSRAIISHPPSNTQLFPSTLRNPRCQLKSAKASASGISIMPTTVVEFATSTITVTRPTATATPCAARQTADICKDAVYASPHKWSLLAWCYIIIPTFVLLCLSKNSRYTLGVIGNALVGTRFERLRSWVVPSGWRKGANEQPKAEDKKVANVVSNTGGSFSLKQSNAG